MAKAAVSDLEPDVLEDTGIPALDEKLAALDDDLQPIDPGNDPLAKKDNATTDDATDDTDEQKEDQEEEAEDDASEADTEDEATQDKGKKGAGTSAEEDEGYILEDAADEADDKGTVEPVVSKPQDQYILDGIKDQAITVRGTVGDSTEVQQFKVLMPEQLPQGFRYVDSREQSIADKAYMQIELEARRLETEYQGKQTQSSTADFQKRENLTERRDASSLQKDGTIPQFKKNPDLPPGFDGSNFRNVINLLAENKDDAAVLIKDVLDFKDKQNTLYAQQYQAGLAYKHIGFDEAFQLYQKANPTKSNPAQQAEDKARHNFAKRTTRTTGSVTTKQLQRSRLPQGATSQDIDNYIESLDL